jgi:ubiquinone/menaquinone biosynthesis C-methylase UbiE
MGYTSSMQHDVSDWGHELRQRLKAIESVFDTSKLIARKADDKGMVARYYHRNRLAYRLVHSKDGFVHMGISRNHTFRIDDFYEQGRIVQSYIGETHPTEVLELAAGKGATTCYLARRNPNVHFHGMDLPNGQLNANAKRPSNLTLSYGDFHDLQGIPSGSVDIVYIIEALCHASNRRRVIAEVFRVLKPGGRFIVFDGYTAKSRSDMTDVERYASDLTFASMMVDTSDLYYGNFKDELVQEKLTIEKEEDLSQYVLPSMKRLESGSTKFLKHTFSAKLITKLFSSTVTANAVAGVLMPITTEMGIHQYWLTVAKK